MKKINNNFKDYYYLSESGEVYNAETKETIKEDAKHRIRLTTVDNKRVSIVLKELYKLVYNKNYCKDNIKDLDNEVWKFIEETDEKYAVSNKGRVKSFVNYESVLLKPNINSGYCRVDIWQYGNRTTYLVHRLVAAAFIETPINSINKVLHHIDEDKTNNCAGNLKWLTYAQHKEIHKQLEREKKGI